MDIILSNSSSEPIYQQIITQIKAQIMSGELMAGDALPSMRMLAGQLRISVITTKRAYEELEREGFIENFAGKGCFVKTQNTDFLREESIKQTEDLLSKACEKAKICGLSLDEMKEIADTKPGFIRAMWCGDRECEDKLKEVAGVTSRCIPFEQEHIGDTCVCCGKKADKMLYWGKAY